MNKFPSTTTTTTTLCLVAILAAACLADVRATSAADVRISPDLCRHLQRGQSRLLFNIFCDAFRSGKPQPPPTTTKNQRMTRRSSEICDRLCEEGNGGAVCDCSEGLPPAVMPPPPQPKPPKIAAGKVSRQNLNFAPRRPVPPP